MTVSERVTAQITFRESFPEFRDETSHGARSTLLRILTLHYTDNLIIVSLTAAVTLLPIMIIGDSCEGSRRQFLPLAFSMIGHCLDSATWATRHCKRSKVLQMSRILDIFLNICLFRMNTFEELFLHSFCIITYMYIYWSTSTVSYNAVDLGVFQQK